MNLELKCNFKAASEYRQITDKFGVQEFYVDIDKDSDFPTVGRFQVNNNKIDLSNLTQGQEIKVSFNISGRKWEKDGKSGFVQNLTAWKIEKSEQAEQIPEKPKQEPEQDDLPF